MFTLGSARAAEPQTRRDWHSELPPHVTDPDALGSMSVGHPHEGFLFNGVQMPKGKEWVVALPKYAWGTEETIVSLVHCIQKVNEKFPDSPRVVIGSISKQDGGPFRPHKSHQSGRDADVGFYYKPGYPSGKPGTRENLDLPRTWELLRAFVTDTDVDMILLDEGVQVLLEGYALSIGEDPVWIGDLFRGNGSPYSDLVKHVPGHEAHMHVRFSSPVARERGQHAYYTLLSQGHLKLKTTKVAHKVASGDTLIGIAKKHHTTVKRIIEDNHLSSNVIRVGEKLEINQPQHLRGALERIVVPRRRLPRSDFKRTAVSRAPRANTPQHD